MRAEAHRTRAVRSGSRALAVAVILAVCVSCDSPSDPDDNGAAQVTQVSVDASQGSIFRVLQVALDAPAAIQVDYWADDVARLRLVIDDASALHEVWLPRLRAERAYSYEVTPLAATGTNGSVHAGTFTTSALPPAVAALTYAQAEGAPTQPLLLVPVMESFSGFVGPIIVDENGEVVWYYETAGMTFGSTRLADGDFVFLDVAESLFRLTPDRQRVSQISSLSHNGIHHAIATTPQNTVLFIAYDDGLVDGETIRGEAIWEWDPAAGTTTKRWSSFDHLDWNTDRGAASTPGNWLHANGISVGQRGNIVVSFRNLNQIISIAPDFGSIEWRLGGPGATIVPQGDGVFMGQHDPSKVATGRVLLFDNGNLQNRPFSRALELAIDPATGTATKVWEYSPQPVNFAAIVSSAQRLSNGNTVVHFGTAIGVSNASGPLTSVEVDPNGVVVWRLVAGESLRRAFRAIPTSSIAGEYEVE